MYGIQIENEPLSQKETAKLLQKRDQASIQHVVLGHIRLIYHVIERYYPHRNDKDDLFQVGAIALISSAKKYKQGKVNFSTYAFRSILNNIRCYIRDSRYERNEEYIEDYRKDTHYSIDETLYELIECENDNISAKLLLMDIKQAIGDMLDRQKRAFWMLVQGYKGREIAGVLGYKRTSPIYRARKKARGKIRRALGA